MLISYIKQIKLPLISTVFCTAVLLACCFLFDIPAVELAYAGAICYTFLALLAVCGFVRFRRRRLTMTRILASLPHGIGELPEPSNPCEEDYVRIILALRDEISRLVGKGIDERRETIDYYTTWAHQIKTPISGMRLLMQSGEIVSPEAEGELFAIERYVDMALGYLRMESEFTDYNIRKCKLDNVVRGVIHDYAGQIIRKKLTLDFTPTELVVLSDEKWLSFVVGQLLSNALKYTKVGGIRIYGEGQSLVIEDSGIGIDPADLPRLGQKGFTGHNGRLEQTSTGLGLYLCKTVLDRLSHTLTIVSVPERGTRVIVGLARTDIEVE